MRLPLGVRILVGISYGTAQQGTTWQAPGRARRFPPGRSGTSATRPAAAGSRYATARPYLQSGSWRVYGRGACSISVLGGNPNLVILNTASAHIRAIYKFMIPESAYRRPACCVDGHVM